MEFKLLNKAYSAFRGSSPWARHPSPVLGPLPQSMAAPYSVLQTTGPWGWGVGWRCSWKTLGSAPWWAFAHAVSSSGIHAPFSLTVSPSHSQVSLEPHLLQETFPGHCHRIGCRPVHSLHRTVVGPALPSLPFFSLTSSQR